MEEVRQTYALLPGSPAIDWVTSVPLCAGVESDQTGMTRPVGGACDSGAYEYRYDEASIRVVKDDCVEEVVPGDEVTYTITGTNEGNFRVGNINITDAVPDKLEVTSVRYYYEFDEENGCSLNENPQVGEIVRENPGSNISVYATIDVGTGVILEIITNVKEGAEGEIENIAEVTMPSTIRNLLESNDNDIDNIVRQNEEPTPTPEEEEIEEEDTQYEPEVLHDTYSSASSGAVALRRITALTGMGVGAYIYKNRKTYL